MKDLYHGTTYDINKIDVTMGKGYKDFGNGFPKYKLKTYQAYRYNLEFDDSPNYTEQIKYDLKAIINTSKTPKGLCEAALLYFSALKWM